MIGRYPDPSDDMLSPRQRETLARLQASGRAKVPAPFRIWLASPDVADAFDALGWFLRKRSALTPAEVEIAVLLTARHWRCAYVLASHLRAAVREGLAADLIAALENNTLENGAPPPTDDARHAAVAATAAALLAGGIVDAQVHGRAVATLGQAALAELCALIGYYGATCMALNLHAVTPGSQDA